MRRKLPKNYAPPVKWRCFPGGMTLVVAFGIVRRNYNVGLKVQADGTDTLIDRLTAARLIREYRRSIAALNHHSEFSAAQVRA